MTIYRSVFSFLFLFFYLIHSAVDVSLLPLPSQPFIRGSSTELSMKFFWHYAVFPINLLNALAASRASFLIISVSS